MKKEHIFMSPCYLNLKKEDILKKSFLLIKFISFLFMIMIISSGCEEETINPTVSNNSSITSGIEPGRTIPASYSLADDQTSIKNQGSRGTCWAFAGVAALEAYYKRHYNITLDLSEQYLVHIVRSTVLLDDYENTLPIDSRENGSSYWGNRGNDGIVKLMTRLAICEERYAPYISGWGMTNLLNSIPEAGTLPTTGVKQEEIDAFEWDPRHIPVNAHHNAKYQVKSYGKIFKGDTATLTSRLEEIISSDKEVVISRSNHVLLLIGYNRNTQQFILKNSYGGSNYTTWTYQQMKERFSRGHFINEAYPPTSPIQLKAAWLGNWNYDNDGWRGRLLIRRFTDWSKSENAATKIGNYYRNNKRYDVNGYFEENGRKLTFYIAYDSNRKAPGTLTGKKHVVYLYSRDKNRAAGNSYWKNIPYGTILNRSIIPYRYGRNFNKDKWLGTWDMNHDGWEGKLTFNSITSSNGVNKVNGYYTTKKGTIKPINATLQDRNHVISMIMNNQPFNLYFHTWTEGTFSGTVGYRNKWYGLNADKY